MQSGFYVYIYSDPRTDEPFYVGKGRKYRAYKHLHQTHSRPMRMKLQELIAAGVEPRIDVHTTENEDAAYRLETLFIAIYGRRCNGSGCLFNIQAEGGRTDGFAGRKHTEESKAKIRAALAGRKFQPETIERMRKAGLARDVSHLHSENARKKHRAAIDDPAYRKKMSDAQKAIFDPARHAEMTRRAAEVTRGRKLTDEHKATLAEVNRNRVISDETRARMSAGQRRRYADRNA